MRAPKPFSHRHVMVVAASGDFTGPARRSRPGAGTGRGGMIN